MIISIITAMDKNRLIGKGDGLPWKLPADMKHFFRMTLGKPVLMGRKTHTKGWKAAEEPYQYCLDAQL